MKSVLTLAAVASSVVAFDGSVGAAGPPGDMSEQDWRSWFKNPNATGTFAFEAFNVSENFPPDETVDGWGASIQVANITDDPEADVPYPGVDISIKAPNGMRLPELNSSRTNSSNWHLCLSFWSPDKLDDDATDDAQDDNGDCSSFLSDDCIDALKLRGNAYYWDGDKCTRMSSSVPEACKKYYGDGDTYSATIGANLSRFDGSTLISQRPQLTGEEDFAMSEEEAYYYAVRGVWTVLISWGRRNESSYDTSDILQPTLLCLHTRNFTEGSENPNAGVRTTIYGSMTTFVTLLASILLTY